MHDESMKFDSKIQTVYGISTDVYKSKCLSIHIAIHIAIWNFARTKE